MRKYAKALAAAVAAGAGALVTALADDAVSSGEWVTVGLAVLAAMGVTYRIPNAPSR